MFQDINLVSIFLNLNQQYKIMKKDTKTEINTKKLKYKKQQKNNLIVNLLELILMENSESEIVKSEIVKQCFGSIMLCKERKKLWSAKGISKMHTLPKGLVRGKKHHVVSKNIKRQAYCHKNASSYHVVILKCKDVGEMTNDSLVNVSKKETKYLLNMIRCLRYLARQRIALQGNENNDNFTRLIMLLRTKDERI